MKYLVLTSLLLIATEANATALDMPRLLTFSCGSPVYTHTAEVQPDGSYVGFVRESTSCSSGGRGSKPRKYAACAAVTWDSSGKYMSVEEQACL